MDFDEYDYLEKEVENLEAQKSKGAGNGGEEPLIHEFKEHTRRLKHQSDKDDGDLDYRLKRSKSREESRDHDKERSSSRRHRSTPRSGERNGSERPRSNREYRDRDREERNGKDRGRDRDQDRDRDVDKGRDKDQDQDRDRERDHERSRRERNRDYEKEVGREREQSRRSRSRSERHREEPYRERSRDTEHKERGEHKEPDRESRHHKEKKEEVAEPEADPERDQRTVFAYQISLKADERDVYEFFSRAGKVRDVRLIMDRNSRRSKGVGYIEFFDVMSVPMAIALCGQPLLGQPVMVKPSEAEKNLVQSTTSTAVTTGGHIGPYSGGARRLYVGNLHFNIKEDQLRQVFEPFGMVELVQLPADPETGHSKGFGFVQGAS